MSILDQIVVEKLREVEANRRKRSILDLEESVFFRRPCYSLSAALRAPGASGIIAEIKRRSPSKGKIHPDDNLKVKNLAQGYVKAGASAISVLTDLTFFGGDGDDLVSARECCEVPLLRKDFVVDEYQVAEAKAMGADAVLLIAAVLSPFEVMRFASIADTLGMETLLEVHSKEELKSALSMRPPVNLIGVNNRNLKDFSVSLDTSLQLADLIPKRYVKVAESGISDPESLLKLREAGYEGFLIGEHFMKEENPSLACADFIAEVERMKGSLA